MSRSRLGSLVAVAAVALAATAGAQQGASTVTAASAGPAVGDLAPDFALSGATRYGVLREPVRLSSLRGETVVLAFFYKARTKG